MPKPKLPTEMTTRLVFQGGGGRIFRGAFARVDAAMKVAHPKLEQALLREARAIAFSRRDRLLGAGWVRVEGETLHFDRRAGALPFLATRWIDGVPLSQVPPSPALAWRVARDIARTLAESHAAGVAHGDVKPDNILVPHDDDAPIELIDWGLSGSASAWSIDGGTPRYLAKESGPRHAKDLFALGLTLVEACTGETDGANAELPEPLREVIGALSCKNPFARPSARWVERTSHAERSRPSGASRKTQALPSSSSEAPGVAVLRSSYLRLRGAAAARESEIPWLAEPGLVAWRELGADLGAIAEAAPFDRRMLHRWLSLAVGPTAASWPVAELDWTHEPTVVATLRARAERSSPENWTFNDLRSAAEGAARATTSRPSSVEIAIALSQPGASDAWLTCVEASVAEAREGDGASALEPRLVELAVRTMVLRGEAGRAGALVRRLPDEATTWLADIARRGGDLEEAERLAKEALGGHDDLAARAILGRIALDRGRPEASLALVAGQDHPACAEVEALAAGNDLPRALEAIRRGESLARGSEDLARLEGTRGFVLAERSPETALGAFRAAVSHAIATGAVVEEATYRTGEAAAAVSEGYLAEAITSAARASLMWESLGRSNMAARAELAAAAAHATLELTHEAKTFAVSAIEHARETSDDLARAYALCAWCDAAPTEREPRAALAELLPTLSVSARLYAAARCLRDLDDSTKVAALDAIASRDDASAASRLDWWGARMRAVEVRPALDPAKSVAALLSLADSKAAIATKGAALAIGATFAEQHGLMDHGARLRSLASQCAERLLLRVGDAYVERARQLPWVRENQATPQNLDGAQVRDLERVVRSLGEGGDLKDLFRRILDALVLWTGVERGLLLLRAPDGRLVSRAARNMARHDLKEEERLLSQTLARQAMLELTPVVAVDARGELSSTHESVHALRLRSVLAVPLIHQGEALGVVYLDDRIRAGAFGEDELIWVRTIAHVAAALTAQAREDLLLRRAVRRAKRASAELERTLAKRELELRGARELLDTTDDEAGIVGSSPAMISLLRTVSRVAQSNVPVLILGESGSGKELVARALHKRSPRSALPFVSENCGAVPETLMESTFFGHVRGAFTGADRNRLGLFDAANGGTLFLDEIGELSLNLQTKLLRIVEDGVVRPIGSERPRTVDVRIVAATNRDLEAMIREKRFREDLFYRLNIVTLVVPPLRERPSDIPLLVRHFAKKHAEGRTISIREPAMNALSSYPWPGNVRQLENEIRRAIVLSEGDITLSHLGIVSGAKDASAPDGFNLRSRVDALEITLVREALKRTGGNQTHAAKLLGLSRFGLQKMVKRLAIQ